MGLLAAALAPRLEAADLYLSAGAGAADATNSRFGGTGVEVDFDLGKPIGVLAAGLTRGSWRFELEGGYRYNDAEIVYFDDGRPDMAVDADSVFSAYSLGANAIYTFDTGWGLRPFVGAGIAATQIDYEINQYITEVTLLDDDASALSYQLIAGLAMPLGRRWNLDLDYRYWQAREIELTDVNGNAFDTDHTIHSAMLHLRYAFGAGRQPDRSSGVEALPSRGWFLHAAAGPVRAKDAEIKDNIANFDAFDIGAAYTLSGGYAFAGPWRVTVELGRRQVEPELIDFNPEFGEDRANGHVRAISVMAGVIWEPRWGLQFQPYLGLAGGMAWSDWDVELNADGSTYVNDEDSAGAVQVLLGAAAPITERLELTAEYRYWVTGLFDLEEPDGRPMRTELTMHSLSLGLRYRL